MPACSNDAPPPATVERVYDFITHLDQAEVVADEFYRPERKVWGDRFRNTDDDDFHALVLPNLTLRFTDVAIHPGAELHYGFGPNKVEVEGPRGRIRFRILIGLDGQEQPVVEQSFNPTVERESSVQGSLDLAELVGQRVTFLFETTSNDPEANSWAAWQRLRLTSNGRPAPDGERPILLTELHDDLLERWTGAAVVEQPDDDPVTRTTFSADATPEAAAAGPVLMASPPAAIRFTAELPANAILDFSAAVRSRVPDRQVKARFLVELEGAVIHEVTVGSAQDGRLQRNHAQVDLGGRQGPVTLTLRTLAAADEPVQAGWVFPQILRQRHVDRARHDPTKPSVLVIVVDTLRADRLGAYGHDRGTSPNFDALAEQSTVFENMIAQSSWTLPSTASMLTGLYPLSHGVLSERLTYLDDGVETLAERLVEEGFSTAGFAGNLLISTQSNFHQGFETFQCLSWPNARKLNRRFLDWLDNHRDDRFFAYLHHVDPHDPYAAPSPYTEHIAVAGNKYAGKTDTETLQALAAHMQGGDVNWDSPELPEGMQHLNDLYDSEVYYWDLQLGALLEGLKARDRLDSTILVITSDHGEEFLEHRMIFHAQQLYQESIRVPLLIRDPRRPAGRSDRPVQSVDLKPTILSLLGLAADPDSQGVDAFASPEDRALFSSTELGKIEGREDRVRKNCVLWNGWKLIVTPALQRSELYFLDQDGGETRDLGADEPGKTQSMHRKIEQWIRETLRTDTGHLQDFDEETRQRMEEMGYIDGR